MTVRELLNLFDNWNLKLRLNDEENAEPIVEYEYIHTFAFYDEYRDKEYEYLLDYEVVSFGFYENMMCIRVKGSDVN